MFTNQSKSISYILGHFTRKGLDKLDIQLILIYILSNSKEFKAIFYENTRQYCENNFENKNNAPKKVIKDLPMACPVLNRAWLIAHDDFVLNDDQVQRLEGLCQRRLLGEPLAYITEEKEFYGLPLKVTPDVLIPRPETEHLVQQALVCVRNIQTPKILDLGTGSGAIALAIASKRKDASVFAVDKSLQSLKIADFNAKKLNLQINLLQSDWFSALKAREAFLNTMDLIVSNPPYIAPFDGHLDALRYEPQHALVAAREGLADLMQIVSDAPQFLKVGGHLWLEHGYNQAQAVQKMLHCSGFGCIETQQDLAGIDRCTGGILLKR